MYGEPSVVKIDELEPLRTKKNSKPERPTFSNPALANGARERGSLPVGSGIQNPKRERRGHPSNQQDIRAYTGAFIELLPTLFLE